MFRVAGAAQAQRDARGFFDGTTVMADLSSAFERLFRAVERLERAAGRQLPHAAEERRRLVSDLAAAQGDLARALKANDAVAVRLDGAIETVRSTLQGE